jgi:hypothetical protein
MLLLASSLESLLASSNKTVYWRKEDYGLEIDGRLITCHLKLRRRSVKRFIEPANSISVDLDSKFSEETWSIPWVADG